MADEPQRFTIAYAPITKQHLRAIEAKYYSLIRAVVDEQLSFEPTTETRNRKPLKRPVVFMATWEIRFGPQNRFRVYYDVDLAQSNVSILAIGSKAGNRIVIGGEEIQL
ncbi:MAG: addiction module toxin RelE [Kouleothrix sp.]|nr:addiction module toxin RelE [Kouleothrix sp.]